MTEEQKYLLKNGCDDLVINEESRPEDWIYVSDIMQRWKEQQLILSGVSHQRELLIAYQFDTNVHCSLEMAKKLVDAHLKAINCG
jgi:hypothetical protein